MPERIFRKECIVNNHEQSLVKLFPLDTWFYEAQNDLISPGIETPGPEAYSLPAPDTVRMYDLPGEHGIETPSNLRAKLPRNCDCLKKASVQVWFFGLQQPGVILGCYMVEMVKTCIPDDILYDAICETSWCLPDAVQMLTPRTIGNGCSKSDLSI